MLMKYERKVIVLTGATGFLGSYLLKTLVDSKYFVIAVTREPKKLGNLDSSFVKVVSSEQYEVENIFSFYKGSIFGIIHTATSYGRNGEKSSHLVDANVNFPLRLLELCDVTGVEVFVNTDTILDKYLNTYSMTKNHFIEWCQFFSERTDIKIVNLKLQHIYGPNDDVSKFTGMIFKKLKNNVSSIDLTPGDQKRDFVYVTDVVDAYMVILDKIDRLVKFQSLEVGSNSPISIKDFVEKARSIYQSSSSLKFGALNYRKGEVMFTSSESSELRSLGWQPLIMLDQGLRLTKLGEK